VFLCKETQDEDFSLVSPTMGGSTLFLDIDKMVVDEVNSWTIDLAPVNNVSGHKILKHHEI